jgi:hypothetical protein
LESIAERQPQLQTGFTEIVSDYFPLLHAVHFLSFVRQGASAKSVRRNAGGNLERLI